MGKGLLALLSGGRLDEAAWEEVEDTLLAADLGVAATTDLVDALRTADLRVEGLMTVPPRSQDPRRSFAELRDLAEALDLAHLSMGMTDDYEVAVEEGATMVRIGRALFGER